MSKDIVVYEDLQVRNLVKNHCLAKSIHDASGSMFHQWVEYLGQMFGIETMAVSPHNKAPGRLELRGQSSEVLEYSNPPMQMRLQPRQGHQRGYQYLE